MGFFNKKKNREISDTQHQIAGRIASRLISAQRRLADRINRRVSQVPIPIQLSLLVVLGLGFGIYCGYLLLRAFF